MFCRLWCSISKGFGVSLAFLLSLICGLSQVEGHGFQSPDRPPIQQAPPPQIEPGTQLFLPLIAGGASPLDHDERPSQPAIYVISAAEHTGDSNTPPPEENRHTFITDTGGHLDGLWFRSDLPDGQLKFTIEITSPVVQQSDVTPEGLLTPAAFVALTSQNFMPPQAILTLQVNDVDDDAQDTCPERDYIRINGWQILTPNEVAPAFLRGGNDQWNEWKVPVPITLLRFPIAGTSGENPLLGINEIAIEVNAECEDDGWAVKVDWGSITLRPNLTNPIVFVPGWTGNVDTFDKFTKQARIDGHEAFNIENEDELGRGIATPEETAPWVVKLIERALTTSGADKVFIVAHSRGGIFVRQALRMYEDLASSVASYLTISTSHHGTDVIDPVSLWRCKEFLGQGEYWQCIAAAHSLTTRPMREFNYGKTCGEKRWVSTELFEIGAGDYASQLDNMELSQTLRDVFAQYGYVLTADAHVEETRQAGQEWLIVSGVNGYILRQGCVPGLCTLTVRWLMPIHENPNENPSAEDYWIDCRPQWKNGEATVPAYSVTGTGWCGDVGVLTATFPWRADAVPFPHSANVDGEFCINHLASNSAPEIYVYALDRLASTVQLSSAQAAAASQVEPEPLAQPLLSVSGILAPGATQAFTVPLEAVLTATFHVFASPHVSVTLFTPNNELVDPSTPAANPQITYTLQPGDEYSFYQYQIDTPADGLWQVQLQASEVVTFGLGASIVSPVSLVAERGESVYRPGETLHIYAAAVDEDVLQGGFTITGTAPNTALAARTSTGWPSAAPSPCRRRCPRRPCSPLLASTSTPWAERARG